MAARKRARPRVKAARPKVRQRRIRRSYRRGELPKKRKAPRKPAWSGKAARGPQPVQPPVKEKELVVVTPRPLSRKQILLCPGPVNTSPAVHSALGGADLCHREPEFTELMQTVRAKLIHALGLDQRTTAVLIGGSGTAALEAAALASVDAGQKLLVINNGVYGSRIAQLARIHQIPAVEIRSPLAEALDLARVGAALKRDTHIGTIAVVHHETSTGMLNPVEEVAALAKKFRRRLVVDAISSLGAEKLDLPRLNVGLCVGSAGKCLHGAPGLSFVLLSQEEAARVAKLRARSLYLDLGLHLRAQDAGDPPFTPAVPLIAAFQPALDELNREGLKGRIARYKERALFLRQGFKKMGLRFLLDEKLLSNTLTALWLPKGRTYAQVHDPLKKAGFVVYAGQSELRNKILRVAHMGQVLQSDLKEFLRVLKDLVGTA